MGVSKEGQVKSGQVTQKGSLLVVFFQSSRCYHCNLEFCPCEVKVSHVMSVYGGFYEH